MEFLGTKGEIKFNKSFEIDSSDRMVFRISTENEVSRIEYEANKLLFLKSREMLEMLKEIVRYGCVANFDNIKQLIKESTELN